MKILCKVGKSKTTVLTKKNKTCLSSKLLKPLCNTNIF